ncbi:MAG: TatD family hydrolase [Kofleriaceae bacterium]
MIDTHCHLDVPRFDADREAALARAQRAGVLGILVPAIRPATWPALLALAAARQAGGVRVALGVHPQIVPELPEQEARRGDPDALCAAIAEANAAHPGLVVAVGECGLDGGTADLAAQERRFRAQLRSARALRLPVIIHVLRAHHLAPPILRQERVHEFGGVLHSYSGGADLVPVYRDLGLCFSFAGPVTYPGARRPVAAARAVDEPLLLAETDAPDQAPAPHRGQRCEPAMVADVLDGLAAARGQAAAHLRAVTTANAQRVFSSWRAIMAPPP